MPTAYGRARASSDTAVMNGAAATSASRRPSIRARPGVVRLAREDARQRWRGVRTSATPEREAAIDERLALLDVHLEVRLDARELLAALDAATRG